MNQIPGNTANLSYHSFKMMKDIPFGWYAILESLKVPQGRVIAVERLGVDLVLWRNSLGHIVVQRDRCPHRSAKLSAGTLSNNRVICPFHGFEFNEQGQCEFVPEAQAPATRICIETFASRENNGFIFLWHGPSQPVGEPLWLENIDDSYAVSGFKAIWHTHISRCIENQLDYIHLPFVHRNSIGRFTTVLAKPLSKLDENRITWYTENQQRSGSYIEFVRPNLWQNRLNPWLTLVLVFIPVNENQTELILRTYHKKFKTPLVRSIFGFVMNQLNRKILNEDWSVVKTQPSQCTANLVDETLVGSDQFIRHYRSWCKANQSSGV